MRPVGEVAHVDALADEAASGKHGPAKIAAAIVGHADLKLGDRVAPVVEAMQAASPRFRGIRHATGWDASPELAQRDIQGVMARAIPCGCACAREDGFDAGQLALSHATG